MNFTSFVTHSTAMAAAQQKHPGPIAIDIMRIATSRPRYIDTDDREKARNGAKSYFYTHSVVT